jgi:SseB protein N-terminal domain/SseB protein C-terminal domain
MTAERLRAAMAAVARERTDAGMRELFAALAEARVLIPVRSVSDAGADIAVIERDGVPMFTAFTSPQALEAFAPGTASTEGSMRALARLALDEGGRLVVDPGSPEGGELGRRDMEWVADGLVPDASGHAQGAQHGTVRIFTLGGELPDGLGAAVAAAAAGREGIRAVHAFDGAFEGGERHLMLGVELAADADPRARDAIAEPVAGAARDALPAGTYVDVVTLPPPLVDVARAAGRRLYPPERS